MIRPTHLPAQLVLALLAGCASRRAFVADNLYDESPPKAPVAARAADVLARPPWETITDPAGTVRYQRAAGLVFPDRTASFTLGEVAVYAADGTDVQLEYTSAPPDEAPPSRVVIRVSVYRAPADLASEWSRLVRRWHERQAGTLTTPLPLPDGYPADSKRMAWTVPVGDGYGGPAFEQVVLFHSGAWSVRCTVTCAADAREAATARILSFLRGIRAPIT